MLKKSLISEIIALKEQLVVIYSLSKLSRKTTYLGDVKMIWNFYVEDTRRLYENNTK